MAGWYRKDLADDARILMLLGLGQADVVKAHLRITEHRVRNEDDDPPTGMEEWKARLQELDLWRTLEELIGVQMAQRARTNRSRKRNATSRDVTLHDVTSHNVTATQHNTTQHNQEPSPAEKGGAKRTPRQPTKGRKALDAWCQAVKDATGTASAEQGKTLEGIASKFEDIVADAGETFFDVVKRRVALNKSIQIRWASQDYATDKTQKPWKPRGNPLDCGNSSKWDGVTSENFVNPYGEVMR